MKKLIIICGVLLVLASLMPVMRPLTATPIDQTRETIGAFTGPRNGTQQDDNIKASLDLLHTKSNPTGVITSGNTWYVDSAETTGTENGKTWATATDTIDEAINLASAGDTILVADGHAETVSAANGFDADVAGISIIGLGSGERRPTITFDDTASDVAIGAAGVTIKNIRFLAGVSGVVRGISVEATGDSFTLENCEFPEPTTSSWEFVRAILVATGANYGMYKNNVAYSADADGATNWLDLDAGVQTGTTVIGNTIIGDYDEGIIHSDDIDLEVIITDNNLTNLDAGEHCIEFTANATGMCARNILQTDVITTALDNGTMSCHGNTWSTPTADVEAVPVNPILDSVTNLIGVDDASNLGVTTNVTADADGSILERLEQLDVDTSAIITDTAAMQPIQEYSITASVATIASGEDVLFTVAGGPIKIVEIIGIVTSGIQAQSTLINYNVAVTTPAGDVPFATDGTALEINGDAAGTLYTWNGVIANDLVATTAGVALGLASGTTTGLIVPPGDIELSSTAASTGAITFYMRYIPLSSSSAVTAP